jgi:hypothetical protein
MHGTVTNWARSPDFQRAFVALRYYFGARGAALTEGLEGTPLQPAAADVVSGLCHVERDKRAQALGVEPGRPAATLDQRGLWR